jgi:anti-sigma regulatory factor (Ser/Thr protein kinase)
VLLEITPVNSHQDVHEVVDRVNRRAIDILTKQLNYPRPQAAQFSVILSEVCQNIIEHAEAGGWVATQTYTYKRRLGGRKVVVIAVMDLGIGFRASLTSAHATRFADRWSDATALESAFMHGMSRFHDPGRGQGLQQIRRNVNRWGGKFSIRSGTARIADVPPWEEGSPLDENLPYLPGAQICIILPDRPATETQETPRIA